MELNQTNLAILTDIILDCKIELLEEKVIGLISGMATYIQNQNIHLAIKANTYLKETLDTLAENYLFKALQTPKGDETLIYTFKALHIKPDIKIKKIYSIEIPYQNKLFPIQHFAVQDVQKENKAIDSARRTYQNKPELALEIISNK